MLNTEAASVDEITEPMSRLSSQGSCSAKCAKTATAPAVPATPRVERIADCASTGVRKFGDLPAEAQNYVTRLEELVGCRIKYISVGPERDACIVRD